MTGVISDSPPVTFEILTFSILESYLQPPDCISKVNASRLCPETARLTDRSSAAYRHLESYTVVDLVVSFSYLGHDLSFRNIPDSTYGVIVKETARRWENDVTDSRAPTLLLEFLERSNSLVVEHDCWGRDF